ncbi:MAG: phosphate starvation-inducible protein PhoH [Zetaproteobacteria bacterium CG12_big_fil_rev_8_21_14_0_65_55_1124]|nr:MAG: phosphate starvation-inducible protein PhoH [Zetaproteobacteria bacterium CG1_02_55_237]PIS19124.1 MAG: phosphate starvation-inducible protein PhoH [Zetaproteobacteria bacterium CG08_land_8_20_14_0_20_55_17]PIW43821.1 MAG: phosphate starvation-inducible protein PhoH [Zetaproteobacteria bacterium CG12_big_fil_rev_8_21_14_0_65_55_1124]PIY52967.1 MAG: phosphate starvation-inducible protein PhoH [Zetaproteobacteria bacterium CG_4_10_14_0_8_um_filter_55_43]PIZ37600.1 MAG: phosphate starvatio
MDENNTQRKIYVLDTNVLIHDPHALSRFDEHDVVLPIVVLEEMDKVKRGFDELARNVREASRQLEELSKGCADLKDGCPLPGGGKLIFELNHRAIELLPETLAQSSGDNRIIAVTMSLQQEHQDREVILVSKDINMRIKARALGLVTEDYRSDRVVEDMDLLPLGYVELDEATWGSMAADMQVSDGPEGTHYHLRWPEGVMAPCINGFVVLPGEKGKVLRCMAIEEGGQMQLHDVHSFRSERNAIWGIQAKNPEQNMAMNLLMDPGVDMVTLLGKAGSGKTLLALACGLHQTLDLNVYDRIIVTRATVPMGQDIGFLPGTEREKLEPWMGAVSDNLTLLLGDDFQGLGESLAQYKMEISSLSFARGRTYMRTWLMVDEAQNLSPHQMKTLITRIGEGSKIIILGNNAQIDTPYLTAYTNGLSMAATRFATWAYSGHVTLRASERSRLAAYAAEVM